MSSPLPPKKVKRSDVSEFNWKTDCFLCTNSECRQRICSRVETLPIREKILEVCNRRRGKWSDEVRIRLNDCLDLVAAEATYHSDCLAKFMMARDEDFAGCLQPPLRK